MYRAISDDRALCTLIAGDLHCADRKVAEKSGTEIWIILL